MPHLPVVVWVVLAITPEVIVWLLHVEETVVRPSIEAERRVEAAEPGSSARASADAESLRKLA